MYFADIHNHMLAGVDDGAQDDAAMFAMIDAAYSDGTRAICFTPHWHPDAFGNNSAAKDAAFGRAAEYVSSKGYNIELSLGNELRCSPRFDAWVSEGVCRTLNGSRYLLVDFSLYAAADEITDGVHRVLNAGYRPVLAHVERYVHFHSDMREVKGLRSDGAVIQLDAGSITGDFGFSCRSKAKKCLALGLADVVASDAHGVSRRTPVLSAAAEFVERKYSKEYAERLFLTVPKKLIGNENI